MSTAHLKETYRTTTVNTVQKQIVMWFTALWWFYLEPRWCFWSILNCSDWRLQPFIAVSKALWIFVHFLISRRSLHTYCICERKMHNHMKRIFLSYYNTKYDDDDWPVKDLHFHKLYFQELSCNDHFANYSTVLCVASRAAHLVSGCVS